MSGDARPNRNNYQASQPCKYLQTKHTEREVTAKAKQLREQEMLRTNEDEVEGERQCVDHGDKYPAMTPDFQSANVDRMVTLCVSCVFIS